MILCHWRCTAIINVFYLHLYILFRTIDSMHFCWRRVHCATFCFCLKDKDSSLFVPLIFLSFELEEASFQTFFLKFNFFQTKPKSEFSSHKVFFMFSFCITVLLVSSAVMRNMILPVSSHVEINSELILSEISNIRDNSILR